MKTQTLLRHLVFTFSFSLFTFHLHSQWVSIPDTNFGKWLNTNGYTACLQGNSTLGWQMDTTCPAVVNATRVFIYNKNVSDLTGIEYFDNLDTLDCGSNQLTTLPPLPLGLVRLDCVYNNLTSLPDLPAGLLYLALWDNNLSSLPPLPGSLTSLDCGSNQFTSLPSLPAGLTVFGCYRNQLSSMPVLPAGLTELYCGENPLGTLPALPVGLTILNCVSNQLSSLPALPVGLKQLYCNHNPLGALPALPVGLTELQCLDNQLSLLPALPGNLKILWCNENQLSGLPALPGTLRHFYCHSNQLTSIPELPDSLYYFACYDNPNLYCLPRLKKVVKFRFFNTGITCLPNYPQRNAESYPSIDTVPLCDIFNNNGCPVYWNISGETYYDSNTDCVKNSGDTSLHNMKVQLWSSGSLVQQFYTGRDGLYSFDTDTLGQYDFGIDTATTPFYVSCPSNNLWRDTLTLADSLKNNKNFALQCKTGFDLTAHAIFAMPFRPAGFSEVFINAGDFSNFYNVHCAAGVSGTVTVAITGGAHYVSPYGSALTPSASGNVLTYTITDFGSVNFSSDFEFVAQTDTTAPLGSQVCFTVSVTPTAGDNNPANNVLTHCFTVVGSYDPNDKQVYPAGDIDTAKEWLTYTVRFQNTGTAEAQHIYITDTLDSDLDVSSFQLLAYSHRPMVQLKENAVRFNFPNINLPDSNTNEPLSHGYVQYKIKLKDNLPIGTAINNTAFIYFDFNTPVVTNTTTNTIAVISGIAASHEPLAVRIYPNPASDAVTISIDESMIGATATVTDITGRKISESKLEILNTKLETVRFASGVYFVTVMNKEGRSAIKKLVIE